MNWKRNGVFVEVGAGDGLELSNTFTLEKYFNWDGLCIEPSRTFLQLEVNRQCKIDDSVVYDTDKACVVFLEDYENGAQNHFSGVKNDLDKYKTTGIEYTKTTSRLDTLFKKYEIPNEIDYLSIDTEGSEFKIIQLFPFDKYNIKLITIEHNYIEPRRSKIKELLNNMGFFLYKEKDTQWDDWYINKKLVEPIESNAENKINMSEKAKAYSDLIINDKKKSHLLTQTIQEKSQLIKELASLKQEFKKKERQIEELNLELNAVNNANNDRVDSLNAKLEEKRLLLEYLDILLVDRETDLKSALTQLDSLKAQKSNLNEEKTKLLNEHKLLVSKLENKRKSYKRKLEKKNKKINASKNAFQKEIQELKENLNDYRSKADILNKENEKLLKDLEEIRKIEPNKKKKAVKIKKKYKKLEEKYIKEVNKYESIISKKTEYVKALRGKNVENLALISELNSSLDEQKRIVQEQTGYIHALKKHASTLDDDRNKKQDWIQRQLKYIKSLEKRVADINGDRTKQLNIIHAKQEEIKTLYVDRNKKQDLIQRQLNHIKSLEKSVTDIKEDRTKQLNIIHAKQEEIKTLYAKISVIDREIHSQNKDIGTHKIEIERLELLNMDLSKQLNHNSAIIESMQSKLELKHTHINQLKNQISLKENELQKKVEKIEKLQYNIQVLTKNLNDLYDSVSWKIGRIFVKPLAFILRK